MSAYPIEIDSIAFSHQGGTKEYHLTLAANAQGQAIIIRRYGKVGKANNLTVDIVKKNAGDALEALVRERLRKGYSSGRTASTKALDSKDLPIIIGRLIFPRLGKDAVLHVDPDFDVSGMKDKAAPPTHTEEGDWISPPPQKTIQITPEMLEQQRREKELAAERDREAKYAAHPLFGRF